jgi:hypothetical protein
MLYSIQVNYTSRAEPVRVRVSSREYFELGLGGLGVRVRALAPSISVFKIWEYHHSIQLVVLH